MLNRIFKLKDNNTTVRTEIIAGITTFMTMAYIVMLNPNLLTNFGADGAESDLWTAVFLATCISSATATFVMAFAANKPFALAPGMGLNSFFATLCAQVVIISGMNYTKSFQTCLCIIFIEGAVFVVLSLLNVREKIVDAIPLCVRNGIAPAMGLMLINIGLGSNVGIYSKNGGPFYVMRDFFGSLTAASARDTIGEDAWIAMILATVTMLVGFFAIVIMNHRGVKASVLLGMIFGSIFYWGGQALFLHENPFEALKGASWLPKFRVMGQTTLFKMNFAGLAEVGWSTVIILIVTYIVMDMFDTIGTFVGAASRAGMVDENGRMPKMKQALLADAVGTMVGACTGTSTVTTFVESASGVEAGGRTGLTSFTTGILFLACLFISPLATVIPPAATSSALIYVGVLMLSGLSRVDLSDVFQLAPVALMLIAMPISGSVGHAIGIGLISSTVINLFTGKAKEISVLTYILSVIFIVKFFVAF